MTSIDLAEMSNPQSSLIDEILIDVIGDPEDYEYKHEDYEYKPKPKAGDVNIRKAALEYAITFIDKSRPAGRAFTEADLIKAARAIEDYLLKG